MTDQTSREIHSSHNPEPDGQRIYRGGHSCRRCLQFIAFEWPAYRVTNKGIEPCRPASIDLREEDK